MKSFSFILQDGQEGNELTKHLHMHIIPRDERLGGPRVLQFKKINMGLERRTESEMAEEA